MTCAKKVVRAVIITDDFEVFEGFNDCLNPQERCPRVGNEGYEKCHSICKQTAHAEINAINAAGHKAKGARIYVNHKRICDQCKEAIERAGIKHSVTFA
jgi:deoxycytidylate deaminase